MSTSTVTMPTRHLSALLTVAPKHDVRYYLCGVCIRPAAGHAIATDGHILLMLELPSVIEGAPEFIIGRQQMTDIVKACKALGKRAPDAVTLEYQPQTGAPSYIRATVGESIFTAPAVDGRFPPCAQLMRPVTPITPNDDGQCFQVPQYDSGLLDQLTTAMMTADNSSKARPYLQPNGSSAAYLYWPAARGEKRMLGLIMPMNADAAPGYLADLQTWARR